MSYVPLDLGSVQESKPVPAGRYDLVIATAEEARTKEGGRPQIKVSIGVVGHDGAPNVSHYISLPAPGDDPNKASFKALLLKRFLTLFSIPHDAQGFDLDDFVGASASGELTLSEPDDNGNVYNRLQVPRIRDEGGDNAARRAPPKR